MRFEVITKRNGRVKAFPCRTTRAVTNLVTDMLNRDDEIVIRPYHAVITLEEVKKAA